MKLEHMQNIVEMYSKDIMVGINKHTRVYIVLFYKNKTEFPDNTVESIQKCCRRLLKDKFTKLTTICIGIIGTTVYIDKEIEIVVSSLDGNDEGTFVKSTTGRTYGVDNLWIKE